jgi:hypothetical protein
LLGSEITPRDRRVPRRKHVVSDAEAEKSTHE